MSVTNTLDLSASLPHRDLSFQLADWTLAARQRLYRRAGLLGRRRIVELGAGWGPVSLELLRQSPAQVTAIDLQAEPLEWLCGRAGNDRLTTIVADAAELPLRAGSADLIVTHFAFLWFQKPHAVATEARRLINETGVLVAVEPDFGGLMAHPESGLRSAWEEALRRAGAEPQIGRQLPGILGRAGFETLTFFCDRYEPANPLALHFLSDMISSSGTEATSAGMPGATASLPETCFLPLWMIFARPRSHGPSPS